MELRQLQLGDNSLRAMYNLRLQVEIALHQPTCAPQTVEDLAQLMTIASQSHHPLVKSAYLKFVRLLDHKRIDNYQSLGLPVNPMELSVAKTQKR